MTTSNDAMPQGLAEWLEYLKLPVLQRNHEDKLDEAQRNQWTHREFFEAAVHDEALAKWERTARALLVAARLPVVKTMDTWNWKLNAKEIRRDQIMPLTELKFVSDNMNLLLIGSSGLGKTHLAIALAHTACSRGITTRFTTAADMINHLYAALADRSLDKAMRPYLRPRLLVIDEVGYLPFSKEAGDLFFQVVSKRYERGSIILTSNRAFKNWNEIFADSIVAAAIVVGGGPGRDHLAGIP